MKALREQACENGTKIELDSSHAADLAEVIARVSAPTLTCDWRAEKSWSEDSDSDGLEVEMPRDTRDSVARRQFLREELDRTAVLYPNV